MGRPIRRAGPIDTEALNACRALIPALRNKHYFNFGGQGTMPQPALDAVFQAYNTVQMRGPFSAAIFDWIVEELAKTRQSLATTFGGSPSSYVLTQNVTDGCNIVIWGMNWAPGDILLLSDCEHPSLIEIAQVLHRRKGVTVEYLSVRGATNAEIAERLHQALKPRTRLLALSHVLWNTGAALDLQSVLEICHMNGTQLLVDGAQSSGVVPINLESLKVDYYAFTGHKWLCGPEGVGALYISQERIGELEQTFAGWRSSEMAPPGGTNDPSRFEVATTAFPLLSGFRAALEFHSQWGTQEQRWMQIKANGTLLRDLLEGSGSSQCMLSEPESGLISFTTSSTRTPEEVVARLEADACMVRTIPEPVCIRASVHYFTTEEDLQILAKSLSAAI